MIFFIIELKDNGDNMRLIGSKPYKVTSVTKDEIAGTEILTNGGFDSDTAWSKEGAWTITGGKAVCTSNGNTNTIFQNATGATMKNYKVYTLKFTISDYSEGGVQPRVGNVYAYTLFNSNGDKEIDITATNVLNNAVGLVAIGGSTTLKIDNFSCKEKQPITFQSAGTWQAPQTRDVEVLVVAGGGSGGYTSGSATHGGGGGGGGIVHNKTYSVIAGQTYPVTIGAGGAGGSTSTSGNDSSFFGEVEDYNAGEADVSPTETVLLVKSNSSDGNTTFTDLSSYNHSITVNGDTHHETTNTLFGNTAIHFDANGDSLVLESTGSTFDFGTSGDFTLEAWIRPDIITGSHAIIDIRGNHGDYIELWTSGAYLNIAGTNVAIGNSGSISANTWYHVAVVRSSGTVTLYQDGKALGEDTTTGQIGGTDYSVAIGQYRTTAGAGGEYWDGLIDKIRIVKGVALWTSDFDPPGQMRAQGGGRGGYVPLGQLSAPGGSSGGGHGLGSGSTDIQGGGIVTQEPSARGQGYGASGGHSHPGSPEPGGGGGGGAGGQGENAHGEPTWVQVSISPYGNRSHVDWPYTHPNWGYSEGHDAGWGDPTAITQSGGQHGGQGGRGMRFPSFKTNNYGLASNPDSPNRLGMGGHAYAQLQLPGYTPKLGTDRWGFFSGGGGGGGVTNTSPASTSQTTNPTYGGGSRGGYNGGAGGGEYNTGGGGGGSHHSSDSGTGAAGFVGIVGTATTFKAEGVWDTKQVYREKIKTHPLAANKTLDGWG